MPACALGKGAHCRCASRDYPCGLCQPQPSERSTPEPSGVESCGWGRMGEANRAAAASVAYWLFSYLPLLLALQTQPDQTAKPSKVPPTTQVSGRAGMAESRVCG